jgi:hypothetical protein
MGWISLLNNAHQQISAEEKDLLARARKLGLNVDNPLEPIRVGSTEFDYSSLAQAVAEAERRQAHLKRAGAATGEDADHLRDLTRRAKAVGVRVEDYVTREGVQVTPLEREIERREAREERDHKAGSDPRKPEEMTDAEWEDLSADEKKEAAASADKAVDTFQDQEYNEMGGQQLDYFNLDMNEELSSSWMYRNFLMREDGPQSSQYTATPMSHLGGFGGAKQASKLHTGTSKGITPQKYISRIMEMDETTLEAFQRDLYAAGFYGSVAGQSDEEPIWGAPDEPTKTAVRSLAYMTMTFKGKLSITEVLDRFRKNVDKNGDGIPDGKDKDKPKPVITLTSQVDLQAAAQDQAVDLMGRRLTDPEASGAVGGYNQLESSYQFGQQTAQINNEAGTFTAPPDPSNYAEQRLRSTQGTEVDAYSYLKNVNTLLRMVGLD